MPASRALRRLLHVRAVEEEQRLQTLESARSELHTLERALTAARDRERLGHKLLVKSFQCGEIADRTAAHVELETATRFVAVLGPRIACAEMAVSLRQQEYLDKRMERRQAETLIAEAEAQAAIESSRRDQQNLDDTFGTLRHRQRRERIAPRPLPADPEPGSPDESSSIPNSGTQSNM